MFLKTCISYFCAVIGFSVTTSETTVNGNTSGKAHASLLLVWKNGQSTFKSTDAEWRCISRALHYLLSILTSVYKNLPIFYIPTVSTTPVSFTTLKKKEKKYKKPYSEKIKAFQQECLAKMENPVVLDRLHVLVDIFRKNSFQECSSYCLLSLRSTVGSSPISGVYKGVGL